jgi:hypothetical protein
VKSMQDAVGRELLWRPRSLLSRTHDLVDPEVGDDEAYATLLWRPGFLLRGPAEAQSGDGCWLFRQQGLFQMVVLAKEGAAPLATLRQHFRSAVLRLEDGREFVWRRESLFSRTRRFDDANGTAVVRFHWRFSLPRSTARVEIDSSAAPAADRALLASLGWYLMLVSRRRAAAYRAG